MEKTFEELVKQNCIEIDWTPVNYIPIRRVEALMQQVCEATIEECLQLALKETIIMSRKSQFDLIPTNRIKLL